ncbi:ribonuclease III [Microbulbifer sp. 2205BS26-8]|uniref:ribonuclease III n=1 Tax=Microbulbifer sp. 2205BS26-8 TaxID=3064386 RepID=UPI00273FF0B8|nr:ribonuclease III [Microbulbifer sp. 2205BS26-8]MDP5210583.1 ribonuclease III [Microbulbifer sp. 2205BS26-8]
MTDLLLERLGKRLGHRFRQDALLELALTHRSHGSRNNERLEFLGDSILGFIIGAALYERFPKGREGQLSHLRAQLVSGETLAKLALELEIGDCLRLGEGEMKSGGCRRASILADAVEALIGAIYLDAGLETARARVLDWFASRLYCLSLETVKDPKTRLQEWLQARRKPLPQYRVVDVSGVEHARQFVVECCVSGLAQPVRGEASSRRAAEKAAAVEAYNRLTGLS